MLPRTRSPDRDKAKEIYLQRRGEIPLTDIAEKLNLSEGTIRGWKAKDNWDAALNGTERLPPNNMERSNKNKERSVKDENVSSYYNRRSKQRPSGEADNGGVKTNVNADRKMLKNAS